MEGVERFVEPVEELLAPAKIPIEINLGEEEREVLEILELKDVPLALVAGGGDGLPVADDGEIVAAQLRLGDAVDVKQVGGELVEKQRLPVLVQAFPAIFPETLFKLLQRITMEKAKQPAIEHQVLLETAGTDFRPAGVGGGCGGGAGHSLCLFPSEHAGDEFGLDLAEFQGALRTAVGLQVLGDRWDVVVAVDVNYIEGLFLGV